jgi:hypothetical protein
LLSDLFGSGASITAGWALNGTPGQALIAYYAEPATAEHDTLTLLDRRGGSARPASTDAGRLDEVSDLLAPYAGHFEVCENVGSLGQRVRGSGVGDRVGLQERQGGQLVGGCCGQRVVLFGRQRSAAASKSPARTASRPATTRS